MDKFSFYNVYLEEMNKLSGREFKKLVNALSKYADTSELPKSLSKKSNLIFNQVIRVINQEKRLTDIRNLLVFVQRRTGLMLTRRIYNG